MVIEINKNRMVNELIELIKVNSPSQNEKAISHLLKQKFSSLGLTVIEDESFKQTKCSSGNLICELAGENNIDPIMFTAHMDTVTVNKQIKPQIKSNYIMSDGTTILGTDNKIGLAIFLEVIRVLKKYQITHGHIQFVLTTGEELGLIGAKAIDRSLLKAKYGYSLDHTGQIGDLITKGRHYKKVFINFRIPINQEENYSAIKIATKFIKKINIGQIDEDTFINMNNFSGESKQDLTYEYVKIEIDIKSFSEIKLNNEIQFIKEKLSEIKIKFNIFASLKTELIYKGFHFDENDKVVKIAKHAAEKINLQNNYIATNYSSDANIFTNFGIPTLNLAVSYENIHTNLEKYHLDNLVKLTQYVIAIIKQVANNCLLVKKNCSL